MEINDLWSGFLGAIIGALLSVLLQYLYTNSTKKIDFTFKLYEEFESDFAYRHRCDAEMWVYNNPIGLINEHYMSRKDHNELESVLYIINFYVRVRRAIEFKQLNEGMIYKLFMKNFLWWHIFLYVPKVNESSWKIYEKDSKKLYEWFEKQAKTNNDLKKFQEYLDFVKNKYETHFLNLN
jgi:hypothetical protein